MKVTQQDMYALCDGFYLFSTDLFFSENIDTAFPCQSAMSHPCSKLTLYFHIWSTLSSVKIQVSGKIHVKQ